MKVRAVCTTTNGMVAVFKLIRTTNGMVVVFKLIIILFNSKLGIIYSFFFFFFAKRLLAEFPPFPPFTGKLITACDLLYIDYL